MIFTTENLRLASITHFTTALVNLIKIFVGRRLLHNPLSRTTPPAANWKLVDFQYYHEVHFRILKAFKKDKATYQYYFVVHCKKHWLVLAKYLPTWWHKKKLIIHDLSRIQSLSTEKSQQILVEVRVCILLNFLNHAVRSSQELM